MPVTDQRRRDIAAIHIAKKDLALDDDTYRAMLWAVARVRSAANLDHAGRRAVLAHLRGIGWRARGGRARPGKPHNIGSQDRGPQIRKIEALLSEAGRPWTYAEGIAKHMWRVERLTFCTPGQLTGIIAALTKDARRHGRRTA